MSTMSGAVISLSVFLGTYTVLPDEKKLDAKIRISWMEFCVVFIPLFLNLFCSYKNVFTYFGLLGHTSCPFNFFENDTIAFTYYLFGFFYLSYKLYRKNLSPAALKRWILISEKLLSEYKLTQLGYLFDKYNEQLAVLTTPSLDDYEQACVGDRRSKNKLAQQILGLLCPAQNKKIRKKIGENVSNLLRSTAFSEHLATTYPMTAGKFSKMRVSQPIKK